MAKILVLRIIMDVEDDVIRDLGIHADQSLFELHHAIIKAFDLDPGEMSSFFRSDEDWNQGEEISMMDHDPGSDKNAQQQLPLTEVFSEAGDRMLYVYDYLKLWTFYLELREQREEEDSKQYPYVLGMLGQRPEDAPEKNMDAPDPDSDFDDETSDQDEDDPYDIEEDWF